MALDIVGTDKDVNEILLYPNWPPQEVNDLPSIYDLTRLTNFCYAYVISGSGIMTVCVTHSIFEQPPASIPIIDYSNKCFCPGL